MRIRFGKRIKFCTNVTHTPRSQLLLFTTSNGVYTVNMLSEECASATMESILINGYYDVSAYQYSN